MFDQNLIFSDSQSLAAAAGNLLCSTSIPTGVSGTPSIGGTLIHDYGRAMDRLKIVGIMTAAVVASGGACSITFQVVQATDAALTASVKVLRQSAAIAKADLALGKVFTLGDVPSMSAAYLGLRYVIATNTVDSGSILAGLTFRAPSNAASFLTLAT